MARLTDMPHLFKTVGGVTFAKRVASEVADDNLFTWAAALAYSWLFAVFPFMIFLLTLLPYLPQGAKDRARNEIHTLVYATAPGHEAADTLWNNIDNNLDNLLHQKKGKLFPRLVGLGLALWAASGGMAMTMAALDKCYEVDRGRPFYHQRPVAMGLTMAVAAMILLVLSLLPVGTFVKHWVETRGYVRRGHPALYVFDVVRWSLSLFLLAAVVALIYYKGPSIRHRFNWLTPGGLFTVVVWLVLGFAFRFYVEKWGKYSQTYGTVGGVVILLLFFYIDAVVLLIGAEIDSEVDFETLKVRRGTRDFTRAEDQTAGTPTSI